jgi:hypothetical protein
VFFFQFYVFLNLVSFVVKIFTSSFVVGSYLSIFICSSFECIFLFKSWPGEKSFGCLWVFCTVYNGCEIIGPFGPKHRIFTTAFIYLKFFHIFLGLSLHSAHQAVQPLTRKMVSARHSLIVYYIHSCHCTVINNAHMAEVVRNLTKSLSSKSVAVRLDFGRNVSGRDRKEKRGKKHWIDKR